MAKQWPSTLFSLVYASLLAHNISLHKLNDRLHLIWLSTNACDPEELTSLPWPLSFSIIVTSRSFDTKPSKTVCDRDNLCWYTSLLNDQRFSLGPPQNQPFPLQILPLLFHFAILRLAFQPCLRLWMSNNSHGSCFWPMWILIHVEYWIQYSIQTIVSNFNHTTIASVTSN